MEDFKFKSFYNSSKEYLPLFCGKDLNDTLGVISLTCYLVSAVRTKEKEKAEKESREPKEITVVKVLQKLVGSNHTNEEIYPIAAFCEAALNSCNVFSNFGITDGAKIQATIKTMFDKMLPF